MKKTGTHTKKHLLRLTAVFLILIMLIPSAIACTPGGGEDTTVAPESSNAPQEETTVPATDGDTTTAAPETTKEEKKEVRSLKILAIGNSFSTDAMQYLWQICRDGGVEEVVLGNLYYGGCSISQHLAFAKSDDDAYTYYKNTTGEWKKTEKYKMSQALADEEWDIVTFQQTSKTCGLRSSYPSPRSSRMCAASCHRHASCST